MVFYSCFAGAAEGRQEYELTLRRRVGGHRNGWASWRWPACPIPIVVAFSLLPPSPWPRARWSSTNMDATVPAEISKAMAAGSATPPTLSPDELNAWKQLDLFYKKGLGYANEMSLRPQSRRRRAGPSARTRSCSTTTRWRRAATSRRGSSRSCSCGSRGRRWSS